MKDQHQACDSKQWTFDNQKKGKKWLKEETTGSYQRLDLFIKVLRVFCPNLTDAPLKPIHPPLRRYSAINSLGQMAADWKKGKTVNSRATD